VDFVSTTLVEMTLLMVWFVWQNLGQGILVKTVELQELHVVVVGFVHYAMCMKKLVKNK
jgi:hypothetical protein